MNQERGLQGSATSLRVTCPSATSITHTRWVCVASTTTKWPLINLGVGLGAVPVLEVDYVWGASCNDRTSLWDIQDPLPLSPCLPRGVPLRAMGRSPALDQQDGFPVWPPSIALLFMIPSGSWLKKKNRFYQVATSYFCASKNLKRRLKLNTSFIPNSQFRREQLTASCCVKLLPSWLKIQLMESSDLPAVRIFLCQEPYNDIMLPATLSCLDCLRQNFSL